MMKMAQQVMSNPDMANMMKNMMGGNGGMPDMSELMKNPDMQNIAAEMMKDPSTLQTLAENPDVAEMAKSFMKK